MFSEKQISQVNLCGAIQKLQHSWSMHVAWVIPNPTFPTSLITNYCKSTKACWRLAYGSLGDDSFQALHLPAFICTHTEPGTAGRNLEDFHTLSVFSTSQVSKAGTTTPVTSREGKHRKALPSLKGCCNWWWGGQCKQQWNTSQSFFPCMCVQWFTGHLQAFCSV